MIPNQVFTDAIKSYFVVATICRKVNLSRYTLILDILIYYIFIGKTYKCINTNDVIGQMAWFSYCHNPAEKKEKTTHNFID